MIRNEHLRQIETTSSGLTQPIIGTPYAVMKATKT
jgi:hypothetical protein